MNAVVKPFIILLFVMLSFNVNARKNLNTAGVSDCLVNENVTLNLQVNGVVEKASDVKAEVDKSVEKTIAIGRELGIEKIQIQSQNFNINSNRGYQTSGYQYNGNTNFQVAPYDVALVLMDRLKELNYYISLNVHMNNSGNCY